MFCAQKRQILADFYSNYRVRLLFDILPFLGAGGKSVCGREEVRGRGRERDQPGKGTQRSELPVWLAVFLLAFIPVTTVKQSCICIWRDSSSSSPSLHLLGRGLWGATLGLKLAKEPH